jgi:hypothetical protein
MTQALYAHMNNKIKKKKRVPVGVEYVEIDAGASICVGTSRVYSIGFPT